METQAIWENPPIWWRISLLDDGLFDRLTQLWLQLNFDRPWHLGSTNIYITNIVSEPQSNQPWVNFCTYAELFDRAPSRWTPMGMGMMRRFQDF